MTWWQVLFVVWGGVSLVAAPVALYLLRRLDKEEE